MPFSIKSFAYLSKAWQGQRNNSDIYLGSLFLWLLSRLSIIKILHFREENKTIEICCIFKAEKFQIFIYVYTRQKSSERFYIQPTKKTRIQYTEMSGKTEQEWPFVISMHAYGTWTAVRCLHVRSFFRWRRTRCPKDCTLSFLFPAISYSFLKRMVNLWLNFPA